MDEWRNTPKISHKQLQIYALSENERVEIKRENTRLETAEEVTLEMEDEQLQAEDAMCNCGYSHRTGAWKGVDSDKKLDGVQGKMRGVILINHVQIADCLCPNLP